MVSGDIMSEFNSAGEAGGSDAIDTADAAEVAAPETFETPEPVGDEPVTEEVTEPATEDLPEVAAEKEAEKAPVTEEELPDGVTAGKNRKGEDGVFVSKDRWTNTIFANHKLVQQAAEVLGEPMTMEALQSRNEAFLSQQHMYNDLTSGVPENQAAVLGFMLDQMKGAKDRGEVGVDPSVPMAQAFYDTLKAKSPDAYANLRFSAARDLVGEMYRYAAESGDKALFNSMGHVARALANVGEVKDVAAFRQTAERMKIPFHVPDEMDGLARQKNDPVSRLQAENQQLKEQLNGRSNTNQVEQFNTWRTSVRDSKNTGITEEAITPALASVADAWKNNPTEYKELVVDRLQKQVDDVIQKDSAFGTQVKILMDQAARATSQAVRDQISAQIRQKYVNRAKLAVEAVKRPIIKFAAEKLVKSNQDTRARREAGQNRTAPQTATTVSHNPVPKDLGFKNNVFDADVAYKQAARLFG